MDFKKAILVKCRKLNFKGEESKGAKEIKGIYKES